MKLSALAAAVALLTLSPGSQSGEGVAREKVTAEPAVLEVRVTDARTHRALPCRLTLTNEQGELATVSAQPDPHLAVRPGVVYTSDGRAKLALSPGSYTLHATRGPEYGIQTQQIRLRPGTTSRVRMRLRREVSTPGLISCDTHVHTLTHSKHGDATVDERLVTLAAEGVELPVATEHDVLADYSQSLKRTGVEAYFTPVIGAEITTRKGHFNIFPVQPGSRLPDPRIEDWPQLMKTIRETPGVQVVVLNHPRDQHSNFRPFDATNFNSVTGENRRGPAFGFDAMEVLNSSAQQSDFMRLYYDWFALLNHGYRVVAVGSSDSHDVNRHIVGQGRTYIAYRRDHQPSKIAVDEACRNLLQGRALVSLGLLTQMTVDDRFGVGDLAAVREKEIRVTVRVQAPSWIRADRVALFANGIEIRAVQVPLSDRAGEKVKVTWAIPRPTHDLYLIAIASGPGVTAAYWPVTPPYQPTSPVWVPRMIGSTNPIWVDADGDGAYTAPRAYAASLLKQTGADAASLLTALGAYDEAVAAQAASLYQAAGHDIRDDSFVRRLKRSPGQVQRGFASYRATLPPR